MYMKSAPRDLHPGSPLCAPLPAVLSEAIVSLIRTLHCNDEWEPFVNNCIVDGISAIRDAANFRDAETDVSNDNKKYHLLQQQIHVNFFSTKCLNFAEIAIQVNQQSSDYHSDFLTTGLQGKPIEQFNN